MPRLSKIGAAALAAFGWTGLSSVTASYLVVAGGAGASGNASGGGGAGGLREGTISLNPTLSYSITVGAGGAGEIAGTRGNNGSDSIFSTITSTGGGAGGIGQNTPERDGIAGGSGGGGSYNGGTGGAGNTPSTSPSQGNAGGTGTGSTINNTAGGGGGGAGSVGGNAPSSTVGGAGGSAVSSSITGSSLSYAGGGGAGSWNGTGGAGGSGVGGAGTGDSTRGGDGVANRGGGAGSGGYSSSNSSGGNGGSGVVIISYVGAQQFGGGVVTVSGGNTIHTFTTSGTLSPLNSLTASYLIVAGGGGGGGGNGGGGAGGLLSGSGLTLDTNSIYAVTVGAGGTAAGASAGGNGGNSLFSMVSTTAVGGGGGGYQGGTTTGASGGSGGGGSYSGSAAGGTGTVGQGNNGGSGIFAAVQYGGGGGGGASAVGANGTSTAGGNGGAGSEYPTSSGTYYAGGGGGGTNTANAGTGGIGGGGAGGANSGVGTAGTANTGGGGGGGATTGAANFSGGAGGSGIVIISYAGSTQLMAGGTVTVAGGNVIHTFTSSGYLTPIVLVNNSLRFRSSVSAYLNRTPTNVATSRRIMTYSAWVKIGILGTQRLLYEGYTSVSDLEYFMFNSSNQLEWSGQVNGGTSYGVRTPAVFRDPSAWYHVVIAIDTTQATDTNRIKIYVNGVQQTGLTTFYSGFPAQNTDLEWNNQSSTQVIGWGGHTGYYDGYMADINMVDGQALTPNSFGTSNGLGVWQPIRYGGSYGTNGFYLPFTNTTSTTTLGFDFSPNGNNWTTNNISLGSTVIQSFTSSSTWTAPAGVSSVSYLVVAGGGGGAYAGGGGAGGYRESTLSVTPGTTYTVTVGGGGSGNTGFSDNSAKGTDSVFGSITSTGGGAGNFVYSTIISKNNGGSGGGAGFGTSGSGSGTSGQGNNGGTGDSNNAGGGGGAFAAGGNAGGGFSGNGGAGITSSISGSSVPRAGGGGGGCSANANTNFGSGGSGGGGSSSTLNGNAGATNTGGGGGASSYDGSSFGNGGQGGSGIVIISYTNPASSTNDSMTDVPTLTSATTANYATINPLDYNSTYLTLDNGNLHQTYAGVVAAAASRATMVIPTTGKFYWEVYINATGGGSGERIRAGITRPTTDISGNSIDNSATSYLQMSNGQKRNNSTDSTYGAAFSATQYIQVLYDATAGAIYFGQNNNFANGTGSFNQAFSGAVAAFTSLSGEFMPCFITYGGADIAVNFGQQPFAYTPPTGFVALNTFNLTTPTIGATASTTANKYFDATIWSGDSTTPRSITNSGSMQPDWVWIKQRDAAYTVGHQLYDSVRGAGSAYVLDSSSSDPEGTGNTSSYGYLSSFNSNGFTGTKGSLSNGYDYVNLSGVNYVAWQWNAGGSTVTNTSGSISAQVRANPTAGFSIVSYTGNGTNGATVGHGLGAKPFLIIEKGRTSTYNWSVQGCGELWTPATSTLFLNSSGGLNSGGAVAAPTDTVFTPSVVAYANESGVTNIAYCFAPVAGYSAIGTYTGGGSSTYPFIYTGFRPRYVLIKRRDSTADWNVRDTSRSPYNVVGEALYPNLDLTEYSGSETYLDILSNGFKLRGDWNSSNASGGIYIYMAFAENPFKYANAR